MLQGRQGRVSSIRRILILFFCFSYLTIGVAQSSGPEYPNNRLGFQYGTSDFIDVSYDYHWAGIQFSRFKPFSRKGYFIFQPGLLVASYFPSPLEVEKKTGYEAGLNLGVGFLFSAWSVELSTGPYYLGADIDRQVRGFLFNNQLYLKRQIQKHWSISMGFRHISNAEVRLPNGGINSLIIGIDYSW